MYRDEEFSYRIRQYRSWERRWRSNSFRWAWVALQGVCFRCVGPSVAPRTPLRSAAGTAETSARHGCCAVKLNRFVLQSSSSTENIGVDDEVEGGRGVAPF